MRTSIQLTSLAIVALLFASCEPQAEAESKKSKSASLGQQESDQNSEKVVPVKVMTIKTKNYKANEDFIAKVHASQEIDMVSQRGGLVQKIMAKSGDSIKRGQKLCDIEGERATTVLKMAKLSEKVASDNWKRLEKHLKSGRSSQLNVDNAKLSYLEAKQKRIDSQKMYNESYCVSPFSGVVTEVGIETFQNLSPGVATLSVANLNRFKVTMDIPESSRFDIKRGSRVIIRDPNSDKTTITEISSIDQKINFKTKKFQAEAYVKNPEFKLNPGVTLKASVESYDLTNKIVIPSTTVLNLSNSKAVMVVRDGRAMRQTVKVSSNNGKESLIGAGLKVGDKLIIEGHKNVVDQSRVRVVSNGNG